MTLSRSRVRRSPTVRTSTTRSGSPAGSAANADQGHGLEDVWREGDIGQALLRINHARDYCTEAPRFLTLPDSPESQEILMFI